MNGQIAAISTTTIAILGVVVVASWVIGIVDILRLPGWAWQRAQQSRTLYLVLVIVLGPLGLVIYVFGPRPKVAPIAESGKAAHLPFDGVHDPGSPGAPGTAGRAAGTASPPLGFGSFGAASPPVGYSPFGAASPPVGYGAHGATSPPNRGGQIHQQPITVTQTFRPSAPESTPTAPEAKPTVPAGWKADPTGRHQFRYWDGFKWTESVADAGVQSTDPVQA